MQTRRNCWVFLRIQVLYDAWVSEEMVLGCFRSEKIISPWCWKKFSSGDKKLFWGCQSTLWPWSEKYFWSLLPHAALLRRSQTCLAQSETPEWWHCPCWPWIKRSWKPLKITNFQTCNRMRAKNSLKPIEWPKSSWTTQKIKGSCPQQDGFPLVLSLHLQDGVTWRPLPYFAWAQVAGRAGHQAIFRRRRIGRVSESLADLQVLTLADGCGPSSWESHHGRFTVVSLDSSRWWFRTTVTLESVPRD